MPIQNSPYQAFVTLLTASGHSVSPAELHGHLLGRSCAGAGFKNEAWLAEATEMVKGELTSDDMTVVLLLPTDDAPLPERAAALGEWCRGFLSGFGLTRREYAMSDEANEVLRDLAAISQVQDALEESEDAETDYMQVMEYLRVAPLLLFTETTKSEAPAAKPSLH